VAVEGLSRLRLSNGDVLTPGYFLRTLTTPDLEVLFRRGLATGLALLNGWQGSGLKIDLSVNLPPSVLDNPQSVDWIRDELTQQGVPGHRLSLEFLEDPDIYSDRESRRRIFEEIRKMGVRMVMDDLGSGYSGLNRLRTLPFDKVKIDRELTSQLSDQTADSQAFIASLINMAHDLDLQVVVEGIESPEVGDLSHQLGADLGQGYAIARPMPAESFEAWASDSGFQSLA
jgi:EAL domain-containing protein (putative c-di-GMP-specific phosphodiesterase class I)